MDLQPRLLSSIPNANQIVSTNTILGSASTLLQLPAIITEQVPDKMGKTSSSVYESLKTKDLIEKDTFSAFGSEDFCSLLEKLMVKKVILTGIETSICIYLTAKDAIFRGINVSIISDGVGCRRESDGLYCLNQLQFCGAEIIPLETFLFNKLKSSSHPSFRNISGLIKARQ